MIDWSDLLRERLPGERLFIAKRLRANRLTPTARLPPELRLHSLWLTYASQCVVSPYSTVRHQPLNGTRQADDDARHLCAWRVTASGPGVGRTRDYGQPQDCRCSKDGGSLTV